jgi:hypothetical protein
MAASLIFELGRNKARADIELLDLLIALYEVPVWDGWFHLVKCVRSSF